MEQARASELDRAGGKPASDGRYALLALLTAVNALNFVDRQLIASFANFIVPDLGLTNTQFGLLTGFVFVVFYAVGGLFMGAAGDLWHRPRLIAIALVLWSGLTAASGAARGFVTMALPRMLIGVGEAALTPASMSLLADRFPRRQLGLAAGVYYAGVPIGAGLSLLMAGVLGPMIGWRACFVALGVAGLLMAPLLLLVRDPEREGRGARAAISIGAVFREAWSELTRSAALRLVIAGGIGIHLLIGAGAFEQLWLVQERGFDRAEIAVASGVAAIGMGLLGNIAGGVLGDAWRRRTGHSRAVFLFWLLVTFLPLGIAYRLAEPGSPLFWAGFGLAYFQLGAFYGPTFATLQELAAPAVRGSLIAFAILVLNLVGVAGGAMICGVATDALAARGVAQPYTLTLLGLTCLAALSAPAFLLAGILQRKREAAAHA